MPVPSYVPYHLRTLSREAAVVACAAVGGTLFALLGVPAAWLSGSMLVVSILGITRPLPDLRRPWFDSTMVMSGALIGSAATPEALAATARYPGSLLILVVGLLAIMAATGAGSADPSGGFAFESAAQPIPAISPEGFLLFMLLLGVSAVFVMGRRMI